jgi:outer membrane protein OmpA-like peptidoglycan-associated protein/phosphoribosyl-dephospho-CoA transferase
MRPNSLKNLALLAGVCGLLPACGRSSYVSTDDAALGRVVVYRNGVAYYERRASIEGDALRLSVPADKIDDFLKSLTVADAKTGKPLPVSFPGAGTPASGSGTVDMTVTLPPAADGSKIRDVVLTYVTESPAWKPSYRVVLDPAGKVGLEGWAIVDNTSGEDWNAVKVGVGSSSALAFRYDLKSVRTVHRDMLQTEERFAVAPPTGGSLFKNTAGEHVIDQLAAEDLPTEADEQETTLAYADAPDTYSAEEAMPTAGRAMAAKSVVAAAPRAPQREKAKQDVSRRAESANKVRALAQSLRQRGDTLVIEGFAEPGEPDPQMRAVERANVLRNQLIKEGVPPAQVEAQGRGVVAGQKAGVRLVAAATPPATGADKAGAPGADASPVGESHFESSTPMSVLRGTSAMVAILDDAAEGEIVYLFDPESDRGDGRFAFRSVLFRNPTDSTLESGPVTVYGQSRFIGEGLTEAIPPHSTAVVPFALDRQVVVERTGDEGDHIARLMTVQRGVLTCEVSHRRTTKLNVTNRQTTAATVLLRHTTTRGWTITKSPQEAEQYGQSRLYRVQLAAGETKTVEIEETTPMTRTLDLRTPDGLSMVKAYLSDPERSPGFAKQMEHLLKLNREMVDGEEAIVNLRQRGDEFRLRMDELHGQIVSLGLTKTGGSLTSHLQAKMRQISEKVQQNTLEIVQRQEKLMLARVAFQDGIAELTLAEGPAVATSGAASAKAM